MVRLAIKPKRLIRRAKRLHGLSFSGLFSTICLQTLDARGTTGIVGGPIVCEKDRVTIRALVLFIITYAFTSNQKKIDMATNTAKKRLEDSNTDETKQIAQLAARAADDKKATDVVIFDVHELTSLADFFVVASAPSDRQVQAIVRNVEDALREQGVKAKSREGLQTSSWVLLDFGDVIFHCFTESARQYYDLEGFWIDAPRIDWA